LHCAEPSYLGSLCVVEMNLELLHLAFQDDDLQHAHKYEASQSLLGPQESQQHAHRILRQE